MGWCYTFGVECSPGCKHPMLVRDSLDACECDECGFVCGGRFANCSRVIFSSVGRSVQLRSLPQSTPWVTLTEPLQPSTDQSRPADPTLDAVAVQPETPPPAAPDLASDLTELRDQIQDIRDEIRSVGAQLSELRSHLAALSVAVDRVAVPSTDGNGHGEFGADVGAASTGDSAVYAVEKPLTTRGAPLRPGPAVAHPQAIAAAAHHTAG